MDYSELRIFHAFLLTAYDLGMTSEAVRSDALHTAYRALKAQVQAAETVADVATIVWPED